MKEVIKFENITKSFDDLVVLDNINLTLDKGKFYTLLGPSGCGKTTILRLIAGFLQPDIGNIYLENNIINNVPANKRNINTVFQDYALFPHLNVFENIAFGLRLKKLKEKDIILKVEEALKFVNLESFSQREITELSGGQKQRVALARAIVNEPEVLLLDEPFSALDLKLRTEMQYELKELQLRLGITFVFVTHDQEEALAMSDYIFVLNNGIIEQQGVPTDIYDEPINRFVADFIGESNIVDGIMKDDFLIEFMNREFECVDSGFLKNENVEVIIRPEDLEVVKKDAGLFCVKVETTLFRGMHYEMSCVDEYNNEWLVHSIKKVVTGEEIGLYFDKEAIHIMKK